MSHGNFILVSASFSFILLIELMAVHAVCHDCLVVSFSPICWTCSLHRSHLDLFQRLWWFKQFSLWLPPPWGGPRAEFMSGMVAIIQASMWISWIRCLLQTLSFPYSPNWLQSICTAGICWIVNQYIPCVNSLNYNSCFKSKFCSSCKTNPVHKLYCSKSHFFNCRDYKKWQW